LLGQWKNFEEMEESLSLAELNLIVKYKRMQEHENRKFAAALKGINLDKDADSSVQKRLDDVKRRAAVKLKGENAVQQEEFADLGFGYEAV
jgi:hypothetical protein